MQSWIKWLLTDTKITSFTIVFVWNYNPNNYGITICFHMLFGKDVLQWFIILPQLPNMVLFLPQKTLALQLLPASLLCRFWGRSYLCIFELGKVVPTSKVGMTTIQSCSIPVGEALILVKVSKRHLVSRIFLTVTALHWFHWSGQLLQ